MRTVAITPDAIAALAEALPPGEPVTMLNLLRFRDQAQYADGDEAAPCSGREAYYGRYAPVATPMVMARGGSVMWAGRVAGHTVCPDDERWDDALIVQYPDISAIAGLFTDPAYQAVVKHRTAALEDSRLLPMREGGVGL